LTTGYNGAPSGMQSCLELGCLRDELDIPSGKNHEICRAIHAEQNTIIQAGLYGVNIGGSTIYCTHPPCILCAKMLCNAGIKRFVTYGVYPDKEALKLLADANIEFTKLKKPEEKINLLD
jgi:dCMP deaminase